MAHTVVLGLGNLLLGDEGVGVHAARALLAGGEIAAEVLDVGTAILDALPALGRAERLVVIDAVQAGGTPGSIYRMPFDQVCPAAAVAGLHGFDLTRALALAGREDRPERVVILGVEPERIEWSVKLSPAVAGAMPFLLDAVRAEVEGSPATGEAPRASPRRGRSSACARSQGPPGRRPCSRGRRAARARP